MTKKDKKPKEIAGSKVKDILFQEETITLSVKNLYLPLKEIVKYSDLDTLKNECNELLEEYQEKEWDWKELLRNQLNSEKWGRAHPLNTIDALELAMEAKKVLKDDAPMECTVSKEVADLLCNLANDIEWPALVDELVLPAIEFKKYFKALKEEEPRKAKEDRSEEGTGKIKSKTDKT